MMCDRGRATNSFNSAEPLVAMRCREPSCQIRNNGIPHHKSSGASKLQRLDDGAGSIWVICGMFKMATDLSSVSDW